VGSRSTIITSQLPLAAWHEWLGEPTLADAILDRIVHGAHKIALKGESLRRRRTAREDDVESVEPVSLGA
jgi:DNA replication protein DnaC